MKRKDFVLYAIHAHSAHYRKNWIIQLFSVVRFKETDEIEPCTIRYSKDTTEAYVMGPEGAWQWVTLEDATPMKPLCGYMEAITLTPEEFFTVKKPTETTYGDLIFNARVLVYAFEDLFEYMTGVISIKKLEAKIAKMMTDDPDRPSDRQPGTLYVADYLKYGKAMSDLAGFTQLFVPAATRKSLSTHPESKALRAKLLEENKDRLHDPAVIADIQNQLVALDKEWLKDDPAARFFMGDKIYNTARKRMFGIHGPESGLDEAATPELIINSLEEGWDISKLPAMVNSLRAGSYYRGALTALGGEAVKFFLRIFQNVFISQPDCGFNAMGLEYVVTKDNLDDLEGRYEIVNGQPVALTPDSLQGKLGKVITVRSPMFCKTPHTDHCAICMGDRNAATPNAMGSRAADIGSTHMSIMMASAHAKALQVVELEEDFLT